MINFTTFKFHTKNYQKNNNIPRYKTAYPGSNLAPLKKDCVSFTSNKALLNKSLLESFDNKDVCCQVVENAKVADRDLFKQLNLCLKDFISSKTNPHGCISEISTRVKQPDSIREKLASELEYAILEDKTKIFSPMDSKDIKKVLGDIIGARIILRKSDTQQTSKIIDALIKEVEAGRLKITNIENYAPKDIDSKLQYFDEKDLKRLQKAVNDNTAPWQNSVEYKTSSKRTGYMALHLDIDLSNDNYLVKNNDYKGEIQILGHDVAKLKEVEDLCYKIRQKKDIKSGHPAYSAFSSYFIKHMQRVEEYPDINDDFTLYTSRAYRMQREKDPIHGVRKGNNNFKLPTIEQCGLTGKIPPELDFNKLALIKKYSDSLYNICEGYKK